MKKLINKRNGIIAGIAAVIVIAAIVLSTTFSQAMTLDEAKEIAKKYVPSTAKFVTSEEEENKFEVMFHDDTNAEGFEVEINKETKQVKKVESQLDNDLGGEKVSLTEEDAKAIVKREFEGVTSVSINLTKDNGLYEYEADFESNEFYGNADIHPESGEILDSTVKYGTAVTIPADSGNNNNSNSSSESTDGMLSYEQAENKALKEAGGGFVKDIDLDYEQGTYYYEIEVIKDNIEYDYIVNAQSGEITLTGRHESYFDYDDDDYYAGSNGNSSNTGNSGSSNSGSTGNNTSSGSGNNSASSGSGSNGSLSSSGQISAEKARSIVLSKVPGATIIELQLERDDGIYVYEGEARKGNYEYSFEINASSGVIISWEKDYEDDWD